ncbi:4-coumarate--CoA ligase-like 6 [Carex littledalei]|uniref:4-coumarate--CoA ligase n=1 Tax=Carex littledalei TaxID=544730 RepID=A0A833RAR8_9POAL|nr:4-coumarate--CoA ligase-like 6 [Carex littledalei]
METDITARLAFVPPQKPQIPTFYCPATGIYTSKHPKRAIPLDPNLDLVSFLLSHRHSGDQALVDSRTGDSIAYTSLQSLVDSFACGLQNIGVGKNHVVMILLPNSILFPVVLLGVLRNASVATPMNPLNSIKDIKKQLDSSGSSLVLTFIENVQKIESLGVRAIAIPESLHYDPDNFQIFNRIMNCDPTNAPKPAIKQSDPAAILYSSGTSGPCKGVVITHQNLISMVELFVKFEASQYRDDSSKNVYLAPIPMFHIYGMSLFSIGLLSLGTMVVVMKRFEAKEAVRAIERYRVTHLPTVPPIVAALLRAKRDLGCDLGSLKQVACGAAPLSQKLIDEFSRVFPHVDFIQGYGMTESTAVATRGFNTPSCKKYTSVGLLAPNMEAKIIDLENGNCLPPGSHGELLLRGPAIMKGYLNNEKATSETIVDGGWLRTGDLAHFDNEGYLYILDRLKDTIKYKGYQIAPADLEALLLIHPDIVDVAVTSEENEETGEIPVAFVVQRSGISLSSSEVMDHVNKQVAPYKKVRKVVFVNSLPKSPTGKVLRRLLKISRRNSKI